MVVDPKPVRVGELIIDQETSDPDDCQCGDDHCQDQHGNSVRVKLRQELRFT